LIGQILCPQANTIATIEFLGREIIPAIEQL